MEGLEEDKWDDGKEGRENTVEGTLEVYQKEVAQLHSMRTWLNLWISPARFKKLSEWGGREGTTESHFPIGTWHKQVPFGYTVERFVIFISTEGSHSTYAWKAVGGRGKREGLEGWRKRPIQGVRPGENNLLAPKPYRCVGSIQLPWIVPPPCILKKPPLMTRLISVHLKLSSLLYIWRLDWGSGFIFSTCIILFSYHSLYIAPSFPPSPSFLLVHFVSRFIAYEVRERLCNGCHTSFCLKPALCVWLLKVPPSSRYLCP